MIVKDGAIGKGFTDRLLSESEARDLVVGTLGALPLDGKRVVVLIPDGTRTAPVPMMFRLINDSLAGRVKALDYLIALGTHGAMADDAIAKLVGMPAAEWTRRWPNVAVHNHFWDRPETFATLDTIGRAEVEALSRGMLSLDVPVRVNRRVVECDHVLICGPVFPHEVAGFSGGNKYFFPGISGTEVIDFTHWLGALITNWKIIGLKHTPVREVIDRAAACVRTPKTALCMVASGGGLAGLYIGPPEAAWSDAADLSARIHIKWVPAPFRTVVSVMPEMYDDIWTGAKGMYKMEPVVADGGEVIIHAPHITEVSHTHGKLLDEIGYHTRDYFVKQWDKFKGYPWGVLAHSTHLRGAGTFEDGVERCRIRVTLATGIPEARCRRIGLGYRDPASINSADYANGEAGGILLVPHAGEHLYRIGDGPAAMGRPL